MKIQTTSETSSSGGDGATKLSQCSRIPGNLSGQSSNANGDSSRPTLEPPGYPQPESYSGPVPQEAAEDQAAENPLTDRETGRAVARTDVGYTSNDVYGAFSIENFPPGIGNLSQTHDDAIGWLNFLGGTNPANFWLADAGVQAWAYYEDYDNWQDTYGMDAVLAAYHSGHGTMDANGVFFAPVGAAWGSEGVWVRSDRMRLGNEQANYIFWSTCFSCRVLGGHSPFRTWRAANQGFRMLFGYETTSVDNPNYGSAFGQEWRNGKPLSTAWLDASWYHISTHQAPSVVACGATAAEAQNRLYTERMFNWAHVTPNYWAWRWYYAANAARELGAPARQPNLIAPQRLLTARLTPVGTDVQSIRGIVDRLGLELRVPSGLTPQRDGGFLLRQGKARLGISANGSFDASIATPNRNNRSQIPVGSAVSIATEIVAQLDIEANAEVVFDQVRLTGEGSGSDRGSGSIDGFIAETTVQFRQLIDGVPVVAPGAGELHITIDNDGKITAIHSSLRGVDRLHPMNPAPDGQRSSGFRSDSGPVADPEDIEQALGEAFARQLAAFAIRGSAPLGYTIVPNSTEVGYAIIGSQATLVAQRLVEFDCGFGLRKQYWLRVPISE